MRCGVVLYHRLLVARGGLGANWVPLNRTLSGVPGNSPARDDGGVEAEVKEGEGRGEAEGNSRVRPRIEIPKVTTRPLNFEEARDMAQVALDQQKIVLHQKLDSLKVIFGGQADAPRTPNEQWYYKKVSFWMKRYENFVGLTEVKAAQARVVESEGKFIEVQQMRREIHVKISDVQKRIKDIHLELEKTTRGEDRYLDLVTQEHQVLKEEINLTEDFKFFEKAERENFSLLSSSVRDSHEKERAQAEKTKYWSLIASVIGTCIGILGATINNRLRAQDADERVASVSQPEQLRGRDPGYWREVEGRLRRSPDSHGQPGDGGEHGGGEGWEQPRQPGQDGGAVQQLEGEQPEVRHEGAGHEPGGSAGAAAAAGGKHQGPSAAAGREGGADTREDNRAGGHSMQQHERTTEGEGGGRKGEEKGREGEKEVGQGEGMGRPCKREEGLGVAGSDEHTAGREQGDGVRGC